MPLRLTDDASRLSSACLREAKGQWDPTRFDATRHAPNPESSRIRLTLPTLSDRSFGSEPETEISRMATANKTQSKNSKTENKTCSKNFNWEDFRPEWAAEGLDRLNAELEKWNDEFQDRSEKFRTESQKRIEKGVKQVQDELRKVPAIKRAEELRQELGERVEKNLEEGVDRVYTGLKLARLDEVKKLERKVAQLNKKLRTLEKQQAA